MRLCVLKWNGQTHAGSGPQGGGAILIPHRPCLNPRQYSILTAVDTSSHVVPEAEYLTAF